MVKGTPDLCPKRRRRDCLPRAGPFRFSTELNAGLLKHGMHHRAPIVRANLGAPLPQQACFGDKQGRIAQRRRPSRKETSRMPPRQ